MMDVLTMAGVIVTLAALALCFVLVLRNMRGGNGDERMAELARVQNETAVRLQAMGDMLANRQAELTRAVNERLDSVSQRLGQSMQTSTQHTVESLQKLNERLAVID